MYIRLTEVWALIFLTTKIKKLPKRLTQLTTDNDSCQGQEGPEDIVNLDSEDEESSTTSSVIAFDVEEEILIEQEMEEHATAKLATDEGAQGQYWESSE